MNIPAQDILPRKYKLIKKSVVVDWLFLCDGSVVEEKETVEEYRWVIEDGCPLLN